MKGNFLVGNQREKNCYKTKSNRKKKKEKKKKWLHSNKKHSAKENKRTKQHIGEWIDNNTKRHRWKKKSDHNKIDTNATTKDLWGDQYT